MKKLLISTASWAILTQAAFADPTSLTTVGAAPLPGWTGVYAGLNAGYNFGTNDPITNTSFGSPAGISVPGCDSHHGHEGMSANSSGEDDDDDDDDHHRPKPPRPCPSAVLPNAAALSQNVTMGNTQSGFMGGAQIGYNYQWSPNVVLGLETEIQGSSTRGGSSANGFGVTGAGPFRQNAAGGVSVNAGLDYLGAVRGRVGYLLTPTMLAYGTAGFAYGGAYANVNATSTVAWSVGRVGVNQTYFGGGSQNQILTGYSAGGGVEWLFTPNWSLKTEAIYWNLGNMNVRTTSSGPSASGLDPAGATFGSARVNYQGVIARVGVNYHVNWGALALFGGTL